MPVLFITLDLFRCTSMPIHMFRPTVVTGLVCVYCLSMLRKGVYKMQTNPADLVRGLGLGFCDFGSGPHCAESVQLVEQKNPRALVLTERETTTTPSTINGRNFMQTVRKVFMRPRM